MGIDWDQSRIKFRNFDTTQFKDSFGFRPWLKLRSSWRNLNCILMFLQAINFTTLKKRRQDLWCTVTICWLNGNLTLTNTIKRNIIIFSELVYNKCKFVHKILFNVSFTSVAQCSTEICHNATSVRLFIQIASECVFRTDVPRNNLRIKPL